MARAPRAQARAALLHTRMSTSFEAQVQLHLERLSSCALNCLGMGLLLGILSAEITLACRSFQRYLAQQAADALANPCVFL
mmetsp:Transcript_69285/g.160513  ORF Transcript_69285/g.160513 Transcript_69285/m.160513 type:complete len:81 (-) Transcript_69285:11-253(-)